MNGEGLRAAMSQAIDPVGVMQRVADQTLELVPGAEGVMIGLADQLGVSFLWGSGSNAAHIGTRVNMDSSLSGLAVRTGQVMWSDDSATDPRVDGEVCRRNGVGSSVCLPLTRGYETLGVLAVSAPLAHAFTEGDVELLCKLSDYVSVAVCLTRDLSRVHTDILQLNDGPWNEQG